MRMDQPTFARVRSIALKLDGVEEAPYFGGPAFKVNGRLLACPAGHPSADWNSLLVPMPFSQRDELLAADPEVYYLKPHYVNFPVIVVRVAHIHDDGLGDLLRIAWRAAMARPPRRRSSARRRKTPRRRS
jgi:hypothetical protein